MRKLFSCMMVLCMMMGLACPAIAEENAAGPLVGGWQVTEDAGITEEVRTAVSQAFGGIDGSGIEPVALLGTQVVAGTNLCVLCRFTPAAEGAAPYYALVYLYQDLQGNVQLLQISELDIADNDANLNG